MTWISAEDEWPTDGPAKAGQTAGRTVHPGQTTLPRLVVPAYFHPAVHPDRWRALAEHAGQVHQVVLNLANGPGSGPDAAFGAALGPLREAGIGVIGYVDTNYGRRPGRAALADLQRYLGWYDVAGVFFDRVAGTAVRLDYYAELARRSRELGAGSVVFNHGAHPLEAYAEHADLLGTFEGPWQAYLRLPVPRWTRSWPASRFYHVVYSVPPEHAADAFLLAVRRRAGCVYITDHGMTGQGGTGQGGTDQGGGNPYDRLPAWGLAGEGPWSAR